MGTRNLTYAMAILAIVSCNGGGSGPKLTMDADSGVRAEETVDVGRETCTPKCEGKVCGPNGCTGDCGSCRFQLETCTEGGQCIPTPCDSTKDCPGDLLCLKDLGYCVICVGDEDCSEGESCGADHECHGEFPCASDLDCKDMDMICDKDIGKCVECLGLEECAEDEYCLESYCVSDKCLSGETKCEDGNVLICMVDGSGWEQSQVCGEGQFCADAACHDLVCIPGRSSCEGDKVMLCNELGSQAVEEEDCAANDQTCAEGACLDQVCLAGTLSCLDDFTKEICAVDGSHWETTACEAEHYCKDGECFHWVCPPEEKFCDEEVAKECNGKGSELLAEEDCAENEQHCSEGLCIDTVCNPGLPFCEDNFTTALCSEDGLEYTPQACLESQYCAVGQCLDMVCTPGEAFCDQDTAKVCNGKGSGTLSETNCGEDAICIAGACAEVICEPNVLGCAGAFVLEQCSGPGTAWEPAGSCPAGTYCLAGSCLPQVCEPNTAHCANEDTVEVCDDKGSGPASTEECTGETICLEGECVPQACEPGTKTCIGGKVATCNASGTDYILTDCGASQYCGEGKCKAQACEPGQLYCDGNVAALCNNQGSGNAGEEDCGQFICISGVCQELVCEPGTNYCEDMVVKECSPDGTSATEIETCYEDEYCEEADGNASCNDQVCEPNELSCLGILVMLCNAKGSVETEVMDCADQEQACVDGECVDTICESDSSFCDDKKVKQCAGDGMSSSVIKTCLGTQYCEEQGLTATCKDQLCTPDSLFCLDDKVMQCNAEGSGMTEVEQCVEETQCVDGECVTEWCGNGVLDDEEECDDGNDVLCDGCEGCSMLFSLFTGGLPGQYVEISNVSGTPLALSNTAFTIEAWAKLDLPEDAAKVFHRGNGNKGWVFAINPQNVEISVLGESEQIAGGAMVGTGWHHVAWTFSSLTSKIWIDGQLAGSKVYASGVQFTTAPTRIGAYVNNQGVIGDYLRGNLDELRISSVVRYSSPFTPVRRHESDTHTLGLWHFDEGSGVLVTDASPHTHAGIALGMQWLPEDCYGSSPDSAACGDGKLAVWEECDDGNTTDGDGCSGNCTL